MQRGHPPDVFTVGGFRDPEQRERDAQRKADIERRRGEKQRTQKEKRRKEMRERRRTYAEEQRHLHSRSLRWLRGWRAAQQSKGNDDADA